MRRSIDLLRVLAASIALLVVLVGLPALLSVAIGWPLPRALPRLAEISETLAGDRPLETATVWKVLAVVLWLAWLQIAAATASEVVAAARGGLPRALPGLHLAHGLVAPLVATIVVAWPAGTATKVAPTAPTPVVYQHAETHAPALVTPTAAPAAPATATVEHTVQRRDTLWDLAERYLGDGFRATELFDLNKGRTQPDGRTLTDPGLLQPGWVLRVPAPVDVAANDVSADEVVVDVGDSLWEVAAEHLGDGHRYGEVYDLNAGRPQPDGGTLSDPSLIQPGWRLDLPVSTPNAPLPVAAPSPTEHPPTSTTTAPTVVDATPATPVAPAAPVHESKAAAGRQDEGERRPFGALGIAGGFLAAGIGTAVAMGRRRQRARRRPGTEVPPLPEASASVMHAVAELDVDLTTRIELSLRHLGTLLRDRSSIPMPVIVSTHDGYLDLLLDRRDPDAPAPWQAVADGCIWRSALSELVLSGTEGPAWMPTLASVGCLEDDGVLLNLEAVGAVAVHGEANAATDIARSMAVEIAVTPLADLATVHVAADAVGQISLPSVQRHDSLGAALEAALEHAAPIARGLAGTGCTTAAELRCKAPEEAWSPAVVVAAVDACTPDDLARLVAVAGEHAGVTAVLVGRAEGAFGIQAEGGVVHLEALGLRCAAQQLDEATVDHVVDLLDAVEEDCIEPVSDESLTLFDPTPLCADGRGTDARLHLRLLGPIEVDGADVKPQQLAILAFLSLHREVTGDALRDAVWGGSRPRRDRFLNTITELRRAVGADVLPTQTDGRYRLCDVWSDLAEVERLLADREGDRASNLRAALELVQGPPLSFDSRHRRHFTWVDNGNHASRWERLVGDAAHEFAGMALSEDDADLARWAAERGLLASPGNETLTRDLLAAFVEGGDRVTAERLSLEYSRAMEDLGYADVPDLLAELMEERRAS